MDGGGEALLVRRSKGKKRPLPAAPAERESGGGDALLVRRSKGKKRPLPAAPADRESGGVDALLVRRSKGKKRPLPAVPAESESGGGGDKFRALWRDYDDLLEETEAKKRRLESANRIKLRLLAEVKFLRKKYDSFVKDDSQQTHYNLKKQARQIPSPVGSNEASVFADHGVRTEVPSTSKSTNFDLNQDSIMNDEGAYRQGHQGHSEFDKFDQGGVDEDMLTTDVKLSVCRDTGNSPASDDKRTIPWEDQLALKV